MNKERIAEILALIDDDETVTIEITSGNLYNIIRDHYDSYKKTEMYKELVKRENIFIGQTGLYHALIHGAYNCTSWGDFLEGIYKYSTGEDKTFPMRFRSIGVVRMKWLVDHLDELTKPRE